jgi:hypothetical protein
MSRFLSNITIHDAYTLPSADGTVGQVIGTDGAGNLSFVDQQGADEGATLIYQDNFTGDGSTTDFSLSQSIDNEVKTFVYVDGVYQDKSTYEIPQNTNSLEFSAAPPDGASIEVVIFFSVAAEDYNQKLLFYGKASGAITKGDAVMFAGVEGDHFLITRATQAAISANHEYFLGLAAQDLVNNEFGYVVEFGRLNQIDTTDFTAGDTIWFDAGGTVDGALTNVEPAAPLAKIQVAAVIKEHQNEGVLFVRPTWYHELGELHDVNIDTVADKDLLTWNATGGYWENSKTLGDITTGNITTSGTVDGVDVSAFKSDYDTHTHTESEVTDFGNYVTNVTHDAANTKLVVTTRDGLTQDLDISQYIDDTNLAYIQSGTLDGATGIATFTRDDATSFTVDLSALLDDTDTNDFLTGASFNTADGVLTLTVQNQSDVTVDLDGRYLQSFTETDTLDTVTGRGATTTNDISTGRITVANNVSTGGFSSFDDYQILLYKNGTSVSESYGIGIESYNFMFNSDDNYRFYVDNALKTTIDSSGNISTTGTLSASGYNNANWDTAYGWGNHAGLYLPIGGKASDSELIDGINSSRIIHGNNDSGTNEGNYNDWNTLSKTGFYSSSNATGRWSSAANWSSVLHFKLYDDNNNYASQLGFNTYDNRIYARTNNNGTWTSWDEIITTANIGSQSVSYASTSGDASSVQGRTAGSSTNNLAYLDSYRNLVINDPESYTGEVRLGAAWDYGGVYASSTLTMASSSDINFVINDAVYANLTTDYFKHNGKIILGTFAQSQTNNGEAWIGRAADRSVGTMTVQLGTGTGRKFEVVDYGWSTVEFEVNDSGTAFAAGDFRAPIFYDSNNTGYYLDPAGYSQLTNIYYNAWLRNNNSSSSGLYWESGSPGAGWHIYPKDTADMYFRTGSVNGGIVGTIGNETARGYIHWTTSNEIGFLNASRSWSLRVDNNGHAFATGSYRAPIFYDSNDTGYYIDPNGTSVIRDITISGKLQNNPGEGYWRATNTYQYIAPTVYYPYIKVARLTSGTSIGAIEYYAKRDSNYPGAVKGTVHLSTYASSSMNVQHDTHSGDGQITAQVFIDNNRDVWMRFSGSAWNSFFRWRWLYNSGITEYDGSEKTNTQPANSAEIGRGESKRFTWGNVSGPSEYASFFTHKNIYAWGRVDTPIIYDTDDTTRYVNPSSDSQMGKIQFNNIVDQGSPVGQALIGRNYAYNTLELKGYGAEMMIGSQSQAIHINYRYCNGVGNNTYTPTQWYWRDGTSTGWSNHDFGIVDAHSSSRAPIFYDRDNTSYYVNPDGGSYLLGLTVNGAIDNYGGVNVYSDLFVSGNITGTQFIDIDKTSQYGSGMDLTFSGSNSTGILIRNNTGVTAQAINFFYSSAPQGARGSITVSSTSTAYNTSSDYRLKENVVPMTGALERVDQLKPSRFNFIGDDKTVDGFLAHEAQEVVPEAVTGIKDEVDDEGNPEYQGIDQGKLVPLLVGAIQELKAEVEALKQQLNGAN